MVSPDYFSTMGISLLKGRTCSDHDNETATRVAIVNETLAERYCPNDDPIPYPGGYVASFAQRQSLCVCQRLIADCALINGTWYHLKSKTDLFQ